MPGKVVEARQGRAALRLDIRDIEIWPGERPDAFDGVPERHGEKFDLALVLPAQEVSASVPGQIFKMRRDARCEVTLIVIGPFRRLPFHTMFERS